MMCAAQAGQRGLRVLLLDHAKKFAEKIRISGGGRCNFTNLYTDPSAFLSQNPHFCKSALRQYTQHDFIDLVNSYGIQWHEKKLGQLFCDHSAQDIIDMLIAECAKGNVTEYRPAVVEQIDVHDGTYHLQTAEHGKVSCNALVIATGGLSIPKIGATKFAYQVAEQFGLKVIPPRAALVPLTFQNDLKALCAELSGVSILQISSYWQDGEDIAVDLCPAVQLYEVLSEQKAAQPRREMQTILSDILPRSLVQSLLKQAGISGRIGETSDKKLKDLAESIQNWSIKPSGTEGYRTAEVTLGGIDTDAISSKTMEVKSQPGLYFIGEALDVTGWLGGYNFQWAWSSGWVAGQNIN